MQFIEGPYVADTEFGSITCPAGDLARVYYRFMNEEVYDNTVRLLAASLEMYKALRLIVPNLPDTVPRLGEVDWPMLRQMGLEALAKVEGRG